MECNMDKKVALITGGSKGIGLAISEKLAANGYNLVINYNSPNSEIEGQINSLKEQYNVDIIGVQASVTSETQINEMFETIMSHFGRLDVLVNNAGITKDGLIMRMSLEQFTDVINTNLTGTFICSKAATNIMKKQRSGKIINISSVIGLAGNAGQANYAASKSGIIGLTKSFAREYAPRNIAVNAVAPGFIETAMTKDLSDDLKNKVIGEIPLKKYGQPTDVANVVAFLASDQADYITGQTIAVDGGMTMI